MGMEAAATKDSALSRSDATWPSGGAAEEAEADSVWSVEALLLLGPGTGPGPAGYAGQRTMHGHELHKEPAMKNNSIN